MQTQQCHVHRASHARPLLWTPPFSLFSFTFLLSSPSLSHYHSLFFPLSIPLVHNIWASIEVGCGRVPPPTTTTTTNLLFLPISTPVIHCLPGCCEIQRHSLLPEMRYPSCNNGRTRASKFSLSFYLPYQIGCVSPGLLALLSFRLSWAISLKVWFYEW